jgi:surfeit locus 1 family protein
MRLPAGPTLVTLCLFVVLVALGTWQLQRLAWKEGLIATIEARRHEAPVPVEMVAEENADYRPATATGRLLHDKELFLNAISLKGEGGYHVLTPMSLENGMYLLVDRGWTPYAKKTPSTRPEGQIPDTVTVKGVARLPKKPGLFAPANRPGANDWYSVDLATMEKATGVAFLPFILEADAAFNPGGIPVGGQTRLDLPNDHLGYALTWYALAATLLIVYFVAVRRRKKS